MLTHFGQKLRIRFFCLARQYNLDNVPLEFRCCATDLGIIFESDLKFKKYIAKITRAAHLRAKLILKSFASRNRKLLAKAFAVYVRPILEYCTPIWSPHSQESIDAIESVQRWFTRCLFGMRNLSYNERLRALGWKSLCSRRAITDLITCYKILHGHITVDFDGDIFQFASARTRGHHYKLSKPVCFIDARKYFFALRIVDVWNALSPEVVSANTVSVFRGLLNIC